MRRSAKRYGTSAWLGHEASLRFPTGLMLTCRPASDDEEVAAARAEGSEMSLDAAVEQAHTAID